jgi:GntR family transcriptional regulator
MARRRTVAAAKPERIASTLEAEIRSGRLAYGERLQSEQELVRRFAVSRTTVRKSLGALSSKGLIVTRMGVGSFVTFNGQTINDAVGWSRALADAGADVQTRILRIETIEDPALAAQLSLESPAFIAVDRLRSLTGKESDDRADETGRAISIEFSRLPWLPALQDLPRDGLRGGSLHKTMHAAGLVPDHGEEWAEIHRLDAEEAVLLGAPAGCAYLRTRRLVRDANGRPIEQVVSLLDPDLFALHLEF